MTGPFAIYFLFLHLVDHRFRNTRERKATIMEQVLHSHHFGQVTKERHAISRTLIARGISQRTHLLRIGDEAIESLHSAARRRARRGL